MLAIEVEYLLGRCVATDVSQRDVAEWPPHPARLFSALVDALADVAADGDDAHASCDAALRWLEALPPPEIAASLGDEVSVRTPVKYWVPINDESADSVRAAPIVEQRKRQERFFPASIPHDPVVVFAWPSVQPDAEQARGLDRLAQRIPYLGHSSSLVRVIRRDDAPPRSIEPALSGASRLRVPGPGRLDRLNAVHELRKTDTLVQPPKGREVAYRWLRRSLPHGPHRTARIVALEGPAIGVEDTARLLSRYRAALLSLLGDDAPSILTGHGPKGEPWTAPHVAYVPLANVGHRFADGSVKGVAVVLPRDIEDEDVLRLDVALGRLRVLHLGQRGDLSLRLVGGHDDRASLDFGRYSSSASTWASVTPIALSLHPKPKKGLTEEVVAAREFAQLGLPEPVELVLQDVSFVRGASRARDTSRAGVSSVEGRVLRHVHVRFSRPVEGPIVVGAGRHMGFGLLLPRGGR